MSCRKGKGDKMNKVFIALLLVTALAAIEGTIVSTAIPSITADLLGVD